MSAALRLLSARPPDTIELAGPMPARVATALGLPSRDVFLAEYRRRTVAVRMHQQVRPADTLWAIAARTYARDAREGVWRLQQRNQLTSATLRPGQKLNLPG